MLKTLRIIICLTFWALTGFILIQINAPYIVRETKTLCIEKQKTYDIELSADLQEFIKEVSDDPDLIISMCYVESNFDPYAVSSTGDYGIMQVNKKYWNEYFSLDTTLIEKYNLPNDPFNPKTNIIVGINALNYWSKHSDNISETLNRYNQGYKIRQTQYSKDILSYKAELERKHYDTPRENS